MFNISGTSLKFIDYIISFFKRTFPFSIMTTKYYQTYTYVNSTWIVFSSSSESTHCLALRSCLKSDTNNDWAQPTITLNTYQVVYISSFNVCAFHIYIHLLWQTMNRFNAIRFGSLRLRVWREPKPQLA